MTNEEAERVVALHALAAAAEEIGDDGWENYPELGEYTWERIANLLKDIAPYPRAEEYREAYDLLVDLTDPTPNGNAQNAQSAAQEER